MSSADTNIERQFGMADVAHKVVTARKALATGRIILGREAFSALSRQKLPKGDALGIAEIAGVQAAKATPTLLPLCHPISLSRVTMYSRLEHDHTAVRLYCLCEIAERTGVEMEALTGVSIALMNIWDLTKPINAALRVDDIKLLYKSGGKQGNWTHPDGLDPDAERIIRGDTDQ